ncbi:phosphatase PAP2 family protein [Terracoccus sp. 273MFTsu3.1]|uniref:phosphatase PAP2 family protein n=1 Tax=Terracoccus sp. 273MFTsu3.1 TaxID=1172188 RepID=UPI0012DBD69B|nr:phosphatase PAP2 family protein [Terracoccus sp. 273MFTsu3.1]
MTTRANRRPARDPSPPAGAPAPGHPDGLWHHVSGPAVALLLGAGFVLLTLSVVRHGAAIRLDDRVLALTPGRGTGPVLPDLLTFGIVQLATPVLSVAVVGAVTMAVCLRTGRWSPLLLAAPSIVVVSTTVLLGKGLISRTSPAVPGMLGGDGSYPSGHTATALVCAGVTAELVSRLRPRRRTTAWAAALVWSGLVVVSLLWLHFHWLSDVVASLLLGSLVLWLMLRWPLRLGRAVGAPWLDEGPPTAR